MSGETSNEKLDKVGNQRRLQYPNIKDGALCENS